MRRFHQRTVTEFLEHTLLHVGSSKVVLSAPVNGFVVVLKTLLGVKHRFQFFPLNVKEGKRFNGGCLIHGGDTSDQIAHVPNLLNRHGVLVLGHRKNTKPIGCILTGGNRNDAGEGFNTARVDGLDACIVMR